jgi:hypothetical protein
MEKNTQQWKWRKDEISMKDFYQLSKAEKEEYILLILGLPLSERGTSDEIILNNFNKLVPKEENFITL